MAGWEIEIVRADDLLKLRVGFINLVLASDETPPRRLVRETRDEDAFVIVHFQPQHIAERSFDMADDGTLVGLPSPQSRFPALISRPSRLGFRLPNEVDSLPLTIPALLDWDRFMQADPVEEAEAEGSAHIPAPPLTHQAAIEIPFRIVLSTGKSGIWTHEALPARSGKRVELWHTRLEPRPGHAGLPLLSAVWSADAPEGQGFSIDLRTTLHKKNRSEVVQLSSDYRLLDEDNFHPLREDERLTLANLRAQRSNTIFGKRLMLSAFGGSLQAQTHFSFPRLGNLRLKMKSHPVATDPGTDDLFSLEEWIHDAVWGRDQNVTVTERGFLYPFGHRASLVTIHNRQFKSTQHESDAGAFLVRRSFLTIQEGRRTYGARNLPFVSITLSGTLTPALDPHPESGSFIPRVGGKPYGFPALAVDQGGQRHDVQLPMVFVPSNEVGNIGPLAEQYAAEVGRVSFAGRPIAFAPPVTPASTGTVLSTDAIRFGSASGSGSPPFLPILTEAEVRLPAIQQFAGRAEAMNIKYLDAYLDRDFAGSGGVFATLIDQAELQLEAEKVGGVAAPRLRFDGLSREQGAIANSQAFSSGDLGQASLSFLEGKLFGAISLRDIVELPGSVEDLRQVAPALTQSVTRQGRTIRFNWKPKLKTADKLPEPLAGTPVLDLNVSLFQPSQASSGAAAPSLSDIRGTLSDFSIRFAKLVEVEFARFEFHLVSGKHPVFDARIAGFAFLGDLSFVNALSDVLPKTGFSDGAGPDLKINAEGVTAGVTLGIPNVSLGGLTLQNLALGAQLSLPFAKPIALRFGLSTREHPFLVSYSLLGGGGFFALTVSAAGDEVRLEAAIEFGAVAALDLVLAKGEVRAMVGVYFSISSQKAFLEGYIRLFGSLEIIKIVTISVEFYLKLSYDGEYATGTASLTVMVRVLAFSRSVTLTVTRRLSTKGAIAFSADVQPAQTLQQWSTYCRAFA